jgi:hypothetical protein
VREPLPALDRYRPGAQRGPDTRVFSPSATVGYPPCTALVTRMPDLSRSQIDRLGRRLRRAGKEDISDQDRELLEQLVASHGPALATVQAQLMQTLGVRVTSRTKTTGTLIEKLERSRSMALSRMQDIAGARLVLEMNRAEQDQLVARIVDLFPEPRRSTVVHSPATAIEQSTSSSRSTSGSWRSRSGQSCRTCGHS